MRALRFAQTGSLDALEVVELTDPQPAAGEVVVQVHAAALHPSDVKNVLGNFRHTTLPRVPGRDAAGVVVAGPAAWQGREVWFSASGLGFTRDGTHAERVCVPEAALSGKPASLSFAQAARCGVPYITVLDALDRAAMLPGERLLVIGAGGAVGQVAVQLARARGMRVIGAVRSARDEARLRAHEVETVLLDTTDTAALVAAVQSRFGNGADVVFDATGHWLAAAVAVLAPHGRIVVIAAPAGGTAELPVLDLYRRAGSLVGVNSLLHDDVRCAAWLTQLAADLDAGVLTPPDEPEATALDAAREAYAALHSGQRRGQVIVPN